MSLRATIRSALPASVRNPLHDWLVAEALTRVQQEGIWRTGNWRTVTWLGESIWQNPADAWKLQEIISEQRPDLIIETGTFQGGSARYMGSICELLGHGEVVTVDIAAEATPPHPRITYLAGSSTDAGVLAQVAERAEGATVVFVMLDSDHSAEHVYDELNAYSSFVRPGGYLHVQDGNIDNPAFFPEPQPGPAAAVRRFLSESPQFIRDLDVEERYLVTAHPYGWLRRI